MKQLRDLVSANVEANLQRERADALQRAVEALKAKYEKPIDPPASAKRK